MIFRFCFLLALFLVDSSTWAGTQKLVTNTEHDRAVKTGVKAMRNEEHEVTFQNPAADIALYGILTTPASTLEYPTAILVHGQGPMDRDAAFFGKKPFRTMARLLADIGIATLRYDKRGIGRSEGCFSTAGIDDFVSDVEAAHAWLSRQPGIDPDKVGLVGISEGGIVAPIVAGRSDRITFCVMMAGPVLPGNENLALSFAILSNDNLSRDQSFVEYRDQFRRLFDLSNKARTFPDLKAEALDLADELIPRFFSENVKIIMGGVEKLSPVEFVSFMSSPCLTQTFIHKPQDYLPAIECPLLALYGAMDVHVPAAEHIAEIREILKDSSNTDFTIELLPETNHLFQKCQTGFPVEYLALDHDISPKVLELIGFWILEKTESRDR